MKKYSLSLLIPIILLFILSGCQDVKKGFSGKKIDEGNEFLVIKKNPLVVPPDFNKLPEPKNAEISSDNINQKNSPSNDFKKLIEKKNNSDQVMQQDNDQSLEEKILDKIK